MWSLAAAIRQQEILCVCVCVCVCVCETRSRFWNTEHMLLKSQRSLYRASRMMDETPLWSVVTTVFVSISILRTNISDILTNKKKAPRRRAESCVMEQLLSPLTLDCSQLITLLYSHKLIQAFRKLSTRRQMGQTSKKKKSNGDIFIVSDIRAALQVWKRLSTRRIHDNSAPFHELQVCFCFIIIIMRRYLTSYFRLNPNRDGTVCSIKITPNK